MRFFLGSKRRKDRKRKKNKKLILKTSPIVLKKSDSVRVNNPKTRFNKTALARLEDYKKYGISSVVHHSLKDTPISQVNHMLNSLKRLQNPINQLRVCRSRKNRKKAIMSLTKGKGMSVKNAKWNVSSYLNC